MTFTVGNWIALLAIVVSSGIAILIGYLHRKQMRQNEAFRQDPSVGLVPPPHPVVAFYKRHLYWIVGVGLPASVLVWNGFDTKPITRMDIILLAGNVAVILMTLVVHFLLRLADRQIRMMDWQIKNMDWQIKNAETLAELAKGITELAKGDKLMMEGITELAKADKVLIESLEKMGNAIAEIRKQPTETTPRQLGGSHDSA
jgi:hypothetical protein